jgi:hypothetical protein
VAKTPLYTYKVDDHKKTLSNCLIGLTAGRKNALPFFLHNPPTLPTHKYIYDEMVFIIK